jgi:hypothetical protein
MYGLQVLDNEHYLRFAKQLHPYSAFGPTTIFSPIQEDYLCPDSKASPNKPRTIKGQNLLIKNHLDQSTHLTNQESVLDVDFANFNILKKMLSHSYFIEFLEQIFINLHPKYVKSVCGVL